MSYRNLFKLCKYPQGFLLFHKSIQHPVILRNINGQNFTNPPHFTHHVNYSTKPLKMNLSLKQSFIDSDQYLEKLRTELTTIGFVNADTLSNAIQGLSFNLSDTESNLLLEFCSSLSPSDGISKKFQLFYKIWDAINKNGKPTKEHYLKAVQIIENEKTAFHKFEKLLNNCSFQNDIEIYEALMKLAAKEGNIQKTQELINEIREKNLKLTENIFNSLILAHSNDGNLSECMNVLDTMNAANILPSPETYTTLINAYISNDNNEKADKLLTEHGNLLKTEQLIKIIRNAALKGQQTIIEKCLKYESDDFTKNVKEVPLIIRKLCIELIYDGYPNEAFLIVNSFPKPNFNENQDIDKFGVFLISEFIKSEQNIEQIIEICYELIASEKNTRALHYACEYAIRKNSKDSIELLKALSKLEKLRSHYFWPIILQKFNSDGEIGIIDTIKLMTQLNIDFDHETLSIYILPRLSITLNNITKAIKIFENNGLKMSQLITPLVCHLIFQQKFTEIITIINSYQAKINTEMLCYPIMHIIGNVKVTKQNSQLIKLLKIVITNAQNSNYDLIGQFLIELILHPKYKNDYQAIINFINELNENNLKISKTAADILIGNLQKNEFKSIIMKMIDDNLKLPSLEFYGSNIAHPRDMTLDELECHLIELETKNLNTRGVLRRLLQMCVREGKLERALEIKSKCDKLKVQVSPGMMASIFDMFIKLKKLEDAEKYLLEIKKTFPGFQIDEFKIIDYAALLAENNRLNDVKKLLIERANTSTIIGGEYIQKNIWQLLNNIAQLSKNSSLSSSSSSVDPNENKTKEIFNILHKFGYCIPHNTILGPIIREYINRKQIKLAVNEYKEITKNYRKTPLQLELISILVSLSNGKNLNEFNITQNESKNLLQEVISHATTVHNSINVNGHLIIAVAESGTEGQLRKLLIDPNFRFNEDSLLKNCEHLSNVGKIDILLKLAKASRGLRHSIKEHDLYDILLNHFIKENNYELALNLYEKLYNDDELKISQDFIKNLINLLKINNYEIPSSLAIKGQIM